MQCVAVCCRVLQHVHMCELQCVLVCDVAYCAMFTHICVHWVSIAKEPYFSRDLFMTVLGAY